LVRVSLEYLKAAHTRDSGNEFQSGTPASW
jgi:hypothetical protein